MDNTVKIWSMKGKIWLYYWLSRRKEVGLLLEDVMELGKAECHLFDKENIDIEPSFVSPMHGNRVLKFNIIYLLGFLK